MRQAVFLDRDGTLNDDPGYVSHPDQMKLLPRVGEALALLKAQGFELVVISNQSGVGRGLFSESMLPRIHERLNELLKPVGVFLREFELCLHHPDDGCDCRKPKPKLLQNASRRLDIDMNRSFMVGDRPADLGAGRNAGCAGVALVRTGFGRGTEQALKPKDADFVGEGLWEVAEWIVSQKALRNPPKVHA